MADNTALSKLTGYEATDETVEEMARFVLKIEAGDQIHRHEWSWVEDALPRLLMRIRQQSAQITAAEGVIAEGEKLIRAQERVMGQANERMDALTEKVIQGNEQKEVNTEITGERREAGEQIYMDGTAMQEGDLVEVWPSTDKFDRPKKWIHAQGYITAIRIIRVVIRSSDDGSVLDFHPADLTLVSRVEK